MSAAAQTGVARPARKPKRERWRQMSLNLVDGFAAAEMEDDMGSKGPKPSPTSPWAAMPKGKGKRPKPADAIAKAAATEKQGTSRKGSARTRAR